MNTVSEIKTPHLMTGMNEVLLQRTCQLVDEWSTKFSAIVEVITDEDVIAAYPSSHPLISSEEYTVESVLVERRYRVVEGNEVAKQEAELIYNLVWRINYAKVNSRLPIVQKTILKLIEAGYTQSAIDDVVKS